MAIRSRIISAETKESRAALTQTYAGYPRPEFRGYCRRFGDTLACFLSPGMLHIDSRAPDVKGPIYAAIQYRSLSALEAEAAQLEQQGMTTVYLRDVIDAWPNADEQMRLPSSVICV